MANYHDLTFYSAPTVVDQIPSSFRIYDRVQGMLTLIQEGRANLMRLLLGYAKNSGAFVATDTETRWGLEYERLARIYMSSDSTSTGSNTHDLLHVTNAEGRRIQAGDVLNLMGFWVSTSRAMAAVSGAGSNVKTSGFPLPEQVKVLENYGEDSGNLDGSAATGYTKIKVRRNFGGIAPTGHADLTVDHDNATYQPFLWKAGNSIAEGVDDQLTYSDVDEYDYNYTQLVMRKWAATDVEQNVNRFFSSEQTFQKNGRKALNEFFKELDVIFHFGKRMTETENGRRKWYMGGIAEFIPAANHIPYGDSLFQTKNFNEQLKDMFYFGSQTKLATAGADFYVKFSNMIDNKIILPAATNSWGVELTRFSGTNGGVLLVAPSDTLSLHGMADYCYIIDPSHFQYGHLQNMDIKTITVPQTNPHMQEAEVFGSVTAKRTNPNAHWVFLEATS